MKEPIFLKGIFTNDIWGGSKLDEVYDYQTPYSTTGSYWGVSAHPNGDSEVINGELKGLKLSEVWNKHPGLFNYPNESEFPIIVKLIDANQDLSIQIHPDDKYAMKNEGELGKTECWYVLDAEADSEVVLGHNAKSEEHFIELMQENEWDKLLSKKRVYPGDFIYVPSGTIHSIGAGILLLEVQQSSDVTYRLYDYDRRDQDGIKRNLHLRDSVNVINYSSTRKPKRKIIHKGNNFIIEDLLKTVFFNIQKWIINTEMKMKNEKDYIIVSAIEGKGNLKIGTQNYYFNKGDHFIITNYINNFEIIGNCKLIITIPPKSE